MTNKKHSVRSTLVTATLLGAAAVTSGCATWQNSAQNELNQAKTVVDTAKAAGADRYAPETIRTADDGIAKAQQLIGLGQYAEASRKAQQAVADGQLAQVQAEAGTRNQDIQKLREEIASLMK